MQIQKKDISKLNLKDNKLPSNNNKISNKGALCLSATNAFSD